MLIPIELERQTWEDVITILRRNSHNVIGTIIASQVDLFLYDRPADIAIDDDDAHQKDDELREE